MLSQNRPQDYKTFSMLYEILNANKYKNRTIVVMCCSPDACTIANYCKCMANFGIVRLCTTLKCSWWEVDMYI